MANARRGQVEHGAMTREQALATAMLRAWQATKKMRAYALKCADVVKVDEDARVYALRRLRVRAGGRP